MKAHSLVGYFVTCVVASVALVFSVAVEASKKQMPEGFTLGCNPCTSATDEGKPFELSFVLNDWLRVEKIYLNDEKFYIKGGRELEANSKPPFYKVEFRTDPEPQFYAVRASFDDFSDRYHYFLTDEQGWHYVGEFPHLRFNPKTKTYFSQHRTGRHHMKQVKYQLKGNQLQVIE